MNWKARLQFGVVTTLKMIKHIIVHNVILLLQEKAGGLRAESSSCNINC